MAGPGDVHQGLLGEIMHAGTLLFAVVADGLQQGVVVLRQIVEYTVTVVGLQVIGQIPEVALNAGIPAHIFEQVCKFGATGQNHHMVVHLGDALEFTDAGAEHILIGITRQTSNFDVCAITGTDGNSSVH